MGKGSNVQKANRARADAAKRAAEQGKGGGGAAGIKDRTGDTAARMEAALKEREKKKLDKEKLQKEKDAKKAKEEKDLKKKQDGLTKTVKNDTSMLDGY